MRWFVFFFKQKTEDELHISDWSSDVCSSDLCRGEGNSAHLDPGTAAGRTLRPANGIYRRRRKDKGFGAHDLGDRRSRERPGFARAEGRCGAVSGLSRSEEHTSELQSIMRISYAVFCLKKQTQKESQQYTFY